MNKKIKQGIMNQIKTIEELIINTKINMGTTEYFFNLLKIQQELYNFLYFKMYQEDDILNPPKKDENKK